MNTPWLRRGEKGAPWSPRPMTSQRCFPLQDSSYLDELSNNNSLFSSPADSLSDIADPKDFLPADSLNHVPTLWDVNTPQQNQIEVWAAHSK